MTVVIETNPTKEGKRELKQGIKIVFSKRLLSLITILNLVIEVVSFKAGIENVATDD